MKKFLLFVLVILVAGIISALVEEIFGISFPSFLAKLVYGLVLIISGAVMVWILESKF